MLSLLVNAIVAGLLLGGFYAAVSVGLALSFGMLDIANLAHPAFIILGSFVYILNTDFGVDPVLAGVLALPFFYLLGSAIYQIYYYSFERRGEEALRGLAFFFGILFITEVALILIFGIQLVLDHSFLGRAIKAVAQDRLALRLIAADPVRIKEIAFALSIATASIAGALLIVITPVEPSLGRDYIGRVFAICVLGGMGSLQGTLLAGLIIGVAESVTATLYGPSWSPAVSFGVLLLVLAVRPSGLLGR